MKRTESNLKVYLISIILIIVLFGTLFFLETKNISILSRITSNADNFKKNEAFDLLSTRNNELLEKSIWKIEQMGEAATTVLVKMLEDKKLKTFEKINIIYALGRLKENGIKSELLLIEFLESNNPDVRAVAAKSLGRMKSKTSTYYLKNRLKDKSKWVRTSVIFALKEIDTDDSKKIIENYEKSLNSNNQNNY